MRLRRAWLALAMLVPAGAALSAGSNLALPLEPPPGARLGARDMARIEEALRLKARAGDELWEGWGSAPIPVMLYSGQTGFLVGLGECPPGWEAVGDAASDALRGLDGPGEAGGSCCRGPVSEPQSFTVWLEGRWVASLAVKGDIDRFLVQEFQRLLPPVLEQIFPYRLVITPSELHVTTILHESFHAHQATAAPERSGPAGMHGVSA